MKKTKPISKKTAVAKLSKITEAIALDPHKQVYNVRRYIIRLLKEQNSYSPELSYQVELLATSIIVYKKIRDEIFKEDFSMTVEEISREGNTKLKAHPIMFLYIKQDQVVRRNLKSLRMNLELDDKHAGNDDLRQLILDSDEVED